MANTMKRALAMLLALVMTFAFSFTLAPSISIDASAAEVDYVYSGSYIYNWGTRGDTATFLSPNAEAFYEEYGSYEELSSCSGGTGASNAPSSQLYKELQSIMKEAHTYQTSYAGTRDLYKYTDCEANGNKISSFYSGKLIGPDWDSGNTWNREHTWPNSKGMGGNDENDIMMLRPTATSENSSRGNTAYGESSGYYNPNKESGGQYDLRGDVARIFLYVYVRWGTTPSDSKYTTWGSSGVIESLEVLLKWIEEDPVDTWELGRNDSVESITGTRNVFVDYPELAFLLFGEEIPDDMTTPSGEGDSSSTPDTSCQHNYKSVVTAPTCTVDGYTTYICLLCEHSYTDNVVKSAGHTYTNGSCTACGVAMPVISSETISFATTDQRESQTTTSQVWKNGNLKFTNNKGGAASNVADYSNPVRLYKGSSILIEAESNITKIVFVASSSSYASDLKAAIGASATISGSEVTVTLDGSANTFTATLSAGQVRLNSLTVFYAEPDVAKFNSASVVLGSDLGMIFNATVPVGEPTVTVEFADKTYKLAAEALTETTYKFTFNGIAPQQMAENIKATLYVDGEAVAEVDNYSVEENLNAILAQDASLADIVNAVLAYGDAAENYKGVEGGVTAPEATEVVIGAEENKLALENAEEFGFAAAGVNFDYANRIYVKFYVEGDFKFYVDGEELAIEKTEDGYYTNDLMATQFGSEFTFEIEDGYYKYYTHDLMATQFDSEFTFEIEVDGVKATLVYSVNSYAYAMQNDADMAELVKALYAYGYYAENSR